MLKYLESDLPQGSDAWLKLREGHITATMASVISGNSPFQNPDKLWKEMLGLIPRQPSNFAMERGKRLEPIARAAYELQTGEQFEQMCVVSEAELDSDGKPWIMASLDGIDCFGIKGIEIKCPGEKTHELALAGACPDYYQDQIQWQFLATENTIKQIDYVCFHPDYPKDKQIAVVNIYPDLTRQAELLSKAKGFRQCLINKIPLCGSEFEAVAKYFVIAAKEAEVANDKMEVAKKLLVEAAGGVSQNGAGVIVSVSERKGTLSYEKLVEQLCAEFAISEDRVNELKAQFTGVGKTVTTVKLANDADRVYQNVLLEQKNELSNIITQVQDADAAQAIVSEVTPVWN